MTGAPSWSSCAGARGCWRWRTRSSRAPAPTSPGRTSSQNECPAGPGARGRRGARRADLPGAGHLPFGHLRGSSSTTERPPGRRCGPERHDHDEPPPVAGDLRRPRVHARLRLALGVACGRKRVARLMRAAGLVGCVTGANANTMMESFWSTMQRELLDRSLLGQPRGARLGDLRMDRRLPQPAPAPLRPGLPVPERVRGPTHRRDRGGMITTPQLSEKPGQAPSEATALFAEPALAPQKWLSGLPARVG
ncbi:IS3 family transposase [Cellulomonas wangsupingiae]|uniref:IS3 family transposase n=1 Tax=Cellulomonas wangsupingiae TaxID=2968085 RepID=UPI001D0EE6AA